jgi:phage gp29-like protein
MPDTTNMLVPQPPEASLGRTTARQPGVDRSSKPPGMKPDAQRIRNDRRTRFNPIATLTPTRLTLDIQSFDLGYMAYLSLLFDAVERRDENIATVAPRRYEAPANLPWDVLINQDEQENPDALRQQAALRYFYNTVVATDALYLNKRGGVAALLTQMNRAVGHFYSTHETIWLPHDPVWQETTDPISKKPVVRLKSGLSAEYRLCPNWWFECITGKLRYLTFNFEAFGSEMDDQDWLVTVGQGVLMPSVINYLFQKMSLNDWVIYNRDFGRPLVDAVTNAAKGTTEWNEFLSALKDIYGAGIVLHNESGKITFNDASKGTAVFKELLELLEKRILRLWRGGEMIQRSSAPGAHGANAQQEEQEKMVRADAKRLEETLNAQADLPVLRWYFGADVVPLAYFRLLPPKSQDDTKEMATDQAIVNLGGQMKLASVAERYGRTVLNGDDIAKPVVPVGQKTGDRSQETEAGLALENVRTGSKLEARSTVEQSSRLAPALAADFAPFVKKYGPLLKRLQTALAMHDEPRAAELAHLKPELEAMQADMQTAGKVLAGTAAADQLEKMLSQSFFNALATAKKESNPGEKRNAN